MNPLAPIASYGWSVKEFAVHVMAQVPDRGARSDVWSGCVLRAARGDAGALAELYDGTGVLVYGLAVRILEDAGAAEEVTEDVYMQAWRQAARYDPERGDVLRWLLTITRSRAVDRRRAGTASRGRHAALELAGELHDPRPHPEQVALVNERRRAVRLALAGLSAAQRQVLELAYFRGLSHSEIAARLGAPLGTVKTRVRVAMQRLRGALGEEAGA